MSRIYTGSDPGEPNVPGNGVPGEGSVAGVGGESVAERHLGHEVVRARKQLFWTQIGSVALSVITLGYLTYLTTALNRTLEPKAASEVALGIVQQQVEERTEELSNDLKTRIPELISGFPDYAKQQLPLYRQQLEQQIDTDLQRYLREHTGELDRMTDEVLEENRETVSALLKDGKDPAIVRELGNDLQEKMLQTLNEVSVGGETLTAKLDASLSRLTELETRMTRLAANRNLTPSEKKARRAIALLASRVEKARLSGPLPVSLPVGGSTNTAPASL
ncbi:MAG: hypothetical protein SFU56_17165 [Capsulimonadales bacterium]|nr:hypothetical protein [Capsulimonadales bacterium]